MMKKNVILMSAVLAGLAFSGILTSCKAKKADLSGRVKIVSTIFPAFDWAGTIISKNDSRTINSLVIKSGSGIHSFKPSGTDIRLILSADLLICTGGKSEGWLREILEASEDKNPGMKTISMADFFDDSEADEHLWLSLRRSEICIQAISDALCALVPEMAESFQSSTREYIEEIEMLDASFKSVATSSARNTLILCGDFPFRCLAQDYNLDFRAAFDSCPARNGTPGAMPGTGAADTVPEATIRALADALNESGSNTFLVLEDSDKKASKAVILEAKKPSCDTLTLDSMEHTALRDAFNGKTYLGTMRENLGVIKKALE